MQQKSFSTKLRTLVIGSSLIALAIIASASVLAAPAGATRLGIRLWDNPRPNCSGEEGPWKYTATNDYVSNIANAFMPSLWAYDSNAYDPDCIQLDLQPRQATAKDFRACIQFADGGLSGSQLGSMECTPWASDGGGASKWAGDSNWYDWDVAQVAWQTREMPAGKEIDDYRIGGQLCDNGCIGPNATFGTTQYTPWMSAGGGVSSKIGDENNYDSDGGRLFLDVKTKTTSCQETIPDAQQAKLIAPSWSRFGLGDSGAPGGWFGPDWPYVLTSLKLKNGFNDRMVDGMVAMNSQNLLTPGGAALFVPMAGNQQIVNCPDNYAVVGLNLYRGGGDKHETGLLCKPTLAGTIDRAAAKEYSINGCGAKYCDPYPNFPTTGVVMIGGRFNTDSHKYLGSIVVAPLLTQTTRAGACPKCSAPPQPMTVKINSGDGEKLNYGTWSSPVSMGTSLNTAAVLNSPYFGNGGGWVTAPAINFPETKWIAGAAGHFNEGGGPAWNVCYQAVENFDLKMDGGVTSATFKASVDDWLELYVNGTKVWFLGWDWKWTTHYETKIPLNLLKPTGSNTILVKFCQHGDQGWSQMATNYQAIISGLSTDAPAPTETVTFQSDGNELYNSGSFLPGSNPYGVSMGTVVKIAPYSTWGNIPNVGWISYGQTNCRHCGPPNNATVGFTDTFTIPSDAVSPRLELQYLADNKVIGIDLNGKQVFSTTVRPYCGGPDTSDFSPGNLRTLKITDSSLFKAGQNTINFIVYQGGNGCVSNSAFGLAYKGAVTYTKPLPVFVPDPSCNACVTGGGKIAMPPDMNAPLSGGILSCPDNRLIFTVNAGTNGARNYIMGGNCVPTSGVIKPGSTTKIVEGNAAVITEKVSCPSGYVVTGFNTGGGNFPKKIECKEVQGVLQNVEDIDLASYYRVSNTPPNYGLMRLLDDPANPRVIQAITYKKVADNQSPEPQILHTARLKLAADCCSNVGETVTAVSNGTTPYTITANPYGYPASGTAQSLGPTGKVSTVSTQSPLPIAGTEWVILPPPSAGYPRSGTTVRFEKDFTIPLGVQIPKVELSFMATGGTLIRINDVPIFNNPVAIGDSPRSVTVPIANLKIGQKNKISFEVSKLTAEASQIGVDFKLTVQTQVTRTADETLACNRIPPAQTGTLNVYRFTQEDFNGVQVAFPGRPAPEMSVSLDGGQAVSGQQPVVFFKIGTGPHKVQIADKPNVEEQFGFCQFNEGGSGCSPLNYVPLPASQCAGGVCTLPVIPVDGGKVTSVVISYGKPPASSPPPPTPIPPPEPVPPPTPNPNPNPSPNPTPAPSCTFTADPDLLVRNIGTSKLEWNCTNTTGTITISDDNPNLTDIGTVNANDSKHVAPDRTTKFTLTVSGTSISQEVTVTITSSGGGEGGGL